MKKKTIIAVAAIALVAGIVIAGTIAWLTFTSDPVKNVFVAGDDLDVTFDETTGEDGEYPMVPGAEISKDPTVTVKEGSVPCYLFFKAEKSDNLDDFVEYSFASDWEALEGVDGVYYLAVESKTESDTDYSILTDDKVTVKDTVTKEMLKALDEDTNPTLTFTVYAIQSEGMEDAADAWAKLNPASND